MRIGVNALGMIPGEVGGAEIYLRRTLASMAKLAPEHEFMVFGNRENRRTLSEDLRGCSNVTLVGTKVRAFGRVRRVLAEQWLLPKLAAKTRVDILWNPGYVAPLRCPCPRITSVLDLQYRHFPEDFTRAGLLAIRFLVASALKRSEGLITISEFSRQELMALGKVPFDRISVTPLAAGDDFSRSLPGDFLAERVLTLLGRADPYLLCVSNSYPHKNLDGAVRAFAQVLSDIPHRLVLVGRARLGEPKLQAAIEALGHSTDRITRLHHVEHEDLIALYQAADAFIFPSLYEGFGLPVLEAMQAGLPVIASRAAAIPEVGGDTIRYAKTDDPGSFAETLKETLFLPQEERARITRAARERAKKFSWEMTARKTLEACNSLLGQRNSKAV